MGFGEKLWARWGEGKSVKLDVGEEPMGDDEGTGQRKRGDRGVGMIVNKQTRGVRKKGGAGRS